MFIRTWYFGFSLIFASLAAQASEVTSSPNPRGQRDVLKDKLVGIYTTYQLRETFIKGCNRLENSISTDVETAFDDYAVVAKDYILEGKRLLNEELSAVDVIEWKTLLAEAGKHYKQKFTQLPVTELQQECQQLAREMTTINKQVIALKSQ
ncbi:hypothetical protein [Photobacterium sp. OFAV2-7]|uniref:hypothetical protein n=1 Tax=Photobacterium sp. OFAV2-7 TaxID=2917748 RepID=UPI001EF4F758|nr:hypothetical protein [Photobacterium sp. OFAV2-7]MCG7587589.1 hypothetical protein [Photobacterium sp. OFAV2-7]